MGCDIKRKPLFGFSLNIPLIIINPVTSTKRNIVINLLMNTKRNMIYFEFYTDCRIINFPTLAPISGETTRINIAKRIIIYYCYYHFSKII